MYTTLITNQCETKNYFQRMCTTTVLSIVCVWLSSMLCNMSMLPPPSPSRSGVVVLVMASHDILLALLPASILP